MQLPQDFSDYSKTDLEENAELRNRFGLFTKRATQNVEADDVPRLTRQFRVNEIICRLVLQAGSTVLVNPALASHEF